jgi:ferric-dicitrate binding protein FerR (iron transport regulator)
MPPAVEAAIQEMRGKHPGWGPRTIAHQLDEAHLRRAAGSETGAEEILDRLRGQEQRLEQEITDWREWQQEHRADLDRLTKIDSMIRQREQHHDRSLDRHPQPSRGVERDLGLDLGL